MVNLKAAGKNSVFQGDLLVCVNFPASRKIRKFKPYLHSSLPNSLFAPLSTIVVLLDSRRSLCPGCVGYGNDGSAEDFFEELAGVGAGGLGDLGGGGESDQVAALVAAFGTHVDDPVGGLDHVQVVLDDYHAVAVFNQSVQDVQKFLHVGEMQPRGGLVQKVKRPSRRPARKLGGEFHPLRLSSGQRGGELAQLDVAQAHLV